MTLTSPLPLHRSGRLTRLLAVLCLALLPAMARADLSDMRLTEIFTGAGSARPSAQWVELMNAGPEPVDLSGAWISADNSSRASQLTGLAPVPAGGFIVIHWNASAGGPVSARAGSDFFTGAVGSLDPSHGSLTLSRSSDPLDPEAMLAFVQWGAADQKGADGADGRGLWPHDQFLPPAAAGHSQALAPGGSPRSPAGWFESVTPTPGALNTAPVSAWRGWRLVGSTAVTPAAVTAIDGSFLDVIGVSTLGNPLHYRFQNEVWSPAITVQAATHLPVALAESDAGTLDMALTTPEGGVFYLHFADGQWSPAVMLGRGALLPPAMAYNPAARELELAIVDPSGQLMFTRSANSNWSPWSPVGVVSGPVAPALAINLLDRPFDLLFTAPDGTVNGVQFDGAWGSPLTALEGVTTLPPAVAVTGAGTVEVVVTAPDHRVYYNRLTDGVWAGWVWTGLESDTAPALLSNPIDDGLELFVAGRDGRLVHARLINGVWGPPWALSGVTGQPAAVAAETDGSLELLLAGADGNLWHNRFLPASPELTSLSGKVQQIFDAHCVQCHDSGDPQEGQNLEADSAYSSLVQVPSMELRTMPRVNPGDPDHSYLVHKISGTQASVGGSGDRMPKGGKLSADEIRTIRDWIAQGALDN